MERIFMILASANGFLAVAMGAFGAHGLQRRLAAVPDRVQRLEWWETAAHYHLTHALALGLVAFLVSRTAAGPAVTAGWVLLAGMILFSGSLYFMTLTGNRSLGATAVPLGGVLMLVGWALAAVAAFRMV